MSFAFFSKDLSLSVKKEIIRNKKEIIVINSYIMYMIKPYNNMAVYAVHLLGNLTDLTKFRPRQQ
eukprot:SAG31_NODE_804_length_11973_cov_8.406855_2_plen_65_part_00